MGRAWAKGGREGLEEEQARGGTTEKGVKGKGPGRRARQGLDQTLCCLYYFSRRMAGQGHIIHGTIRIILGD